KLLAKSYDMLEFYLKGYDFQSKEELVQLIVDDKHFVDFQDYKSIKDSVLERVNSLKYEELLELKRIFKI
ncbi:MAG: hypothetical protein K5923_03285, partial [Clostridia bacterium]|nr:hypothetical protein [Clostridia bacterium]